jgi:hypothetical protein
MAQEFRKTLWPPVSDVHVKDEVVSHAGGKCPVRTSVKCALDAIQVGRG